LKNIKERRSESPARIEEKIEEYEERIRRFLSPLLFSGQEHQNQQPRHNLVTLACTGVVVHNFLKRERTSEEAQRQRQRQRERETHRHVKQAGTEEELVKIVLVLIL
jgi:GrpB-like predicted nucleotidyltransferase (UPF0157 family)